VRTSGRGRIAGGKRAWVALLYGIATPVLFRTGHLNHNLLVGDAGIVALLLLWDAEDRPLSPGCAVLAGLLAGYAILCDYSGVVVAFVTFLYAWMRSGGRPVRVVAAFAAGCSPGVGALALYQAWAFGSLFLPRSITCMPPRQLRTGIVDSIGRRPR